MLPLRCLAAAGLALTVASAPAAVDVAALWDFARPEVSEQRFRDALSRAAGDDALILRTQIARTFGLRRRFDEARAELEALRPALTAAGAEARVRWWLEWGRSLASATHDRAQIPEADRRAAREAFEAAAALAAPARLDALHVDALHMIPFALTDPAASLQANERALAAALASDQPAARRWEVSLRSNLGMDLQDAGRHAEALAQFEAAVAALQAQGAPPARLRIGHWRVARSLRLLGRRDEALAIQQRLARENAEAGTPDPYVDEELALLAAGAPR